MSISSKIKSGFTLIELLVVISIIAILMAIMMPALSRARDQARRTMCGSNSRTIGVAVVQFTTDNDDWLPVYDARQFSNSPYRGLYPHTSFWYVDLAPYLDYGEHTDFLGTDPKVASQRGYEAPSILSCPSLSVTETNGVTSLAFGWNWRYGGYRYDTSFRGDWWKPRRFSQIQNPSVSGIFGENRWDVEKIYAWGGGGGAFTEGKFYYTDRHFGGGHYIAADGHLEFATHDDLVVDFLSKGPITIIRPER